MEGQAVRFDPENLRWEGGTCRELHNFANILKFSRVAGSHAIRAWALANRRPWCEVPGKTPHGGQSPVATLGTNWAQMPCDNDLNEIFASEGMTKGADRVWAIDVSGMPMERTASGVFSKRDLSVQAASLSVPETAGPVAAISFGGNVYSWNGEVWSPFSCFERRNGVKIPIVVRQMRETAMTRTVASYCFLLSSSGRLYGAKGRETVR